jgi:chorismate dehydratase
MGYRVGCVPFVNAKPLIAKFAVEPTVEVRLDIPSRLPAMLDDPEQGCQAVLASSFDALTTPGRRIVWGVCIGSFGPAASVRLFSRKPFSEIETLALDQSSLTSNHLAQILLCEVYRASPRVEVRPPDLEAMLADHDACILIGDKGLMTEGGGLHILDLGEAWTKMTGLPFVWAVWIGNDELDPFLATELNEAYQWWLERRGDLLPGVAERAGWELGVCAQYLEQTMLFRFEDHEWEGLMRFRDLLVKRGFAAEAITPTVVEPLPSMAAR